MQVKADGQCKMAVNQASINQQDVKQTEVPLPPIAEQARILALIKQQLSINSKLDEEFDSEYRRADRLRQSILKRAFEGKLVPQDPNDEPASVLLERIRTSEMLLRRITIKNGIDRSHAQTSSAVKASYTSSPIGKFKRRCT